MTIHDRLSSWVVSSDSASENGETPGFTYTKTRKGQTTAWADAPGGDGLRLMAPCLGRSRPTTTRLRDGVTYTVSFNVKTDAGCVRRGC